MTNKNSFVYGIKICIIGDTFVGKSSMIKRLIHNTYSKIYDMTVGIDVVMTDLHVDKDIVKTTIYDVSGDDNFNFIIPHIGKEVVLFVIVVDINEVDLNSNTSITHCVSYNKWYNKILEEFGEDKLVIGIYSKNDIGALTCDLSLSSKTDFNVRHCFNSIVKLVINSKIRPFITDLDYGYSIDKQLHDFNISNNSSCSVKKHIKKNRICLPWF